MLKRLAALALAALALPMPASAGPAGDQLREALYSGRIEAGAVALKPLADGGDREAQFGLGMLTFVNALEDLAQAMHRHGLSTPDGGRMADEMMGPLPLLPVPPNPDPEPLDYALFRAVLEGFVAKLDSAATVLEAAGADGDYVVGLDLLQFRIDIDGDGTASDSETVGNVIARALGIDPPRAPTRPVAPPPPGGDRAQAPADPDQPELMPTVIGFDRADAIWLAGYSNVLASQADYLLAHDFSAFFDAVFHRFFPRAGLPMQDYSGGGQLMMDPETDNAIADLIAAIHTINWPVVEAARLKRVHERFTTVTALSRRNWEAILAETDDQNELVPSPRQTPMVPEAAVTEEMVAAWHETLDSVDRILAGELLIPHWRFRQGFDLKAYFETATRTDFVMILTGHGALPFLRDGPIADANTFAEADRVFGGNLIGYAFWFN